MKNKIREMRLKKGLSQAEVAEIIRVSRQTIISIEKGVCVPSTLLALRLSKLFGKTVNELFSLPGKK
ncbi:MAG: helix-turn-helix transcriptional regulator [candidate division Zixibacteria bacterium]|nr:helix-turn-helix transcriptional regulator [candidate division Zixibacteria bacterium]